MARSASNTASGGSAWQWSRTAETRRVLLNAAREVFCEQGFAEASIAAVVERADSSVGSLYHHFGGKAELFLALWEEHQAVHEQNAVAAVAAARSGAGAGNEDPLELFIVGARAFLEGSWQRRDLALLFMDGGGPPGFELVRRTRSREWVRQNGVLLGAGSDSVDRLMVAVLTTIIGEAGREIATSPSKRQANKITEAAIVLIRRLGSTSIDT
ncbi:TetR/AcrR family transcriptional regulator [Streptomyces tsukubensis]|uniref:TetR family transcriptional regulator n=1 Tax=Streptomyces tsukubensis TaxID=83656 RepID=A0A1V4A231_9ACTN|nr:TetR/AcrR family transcriptional regulator [Streptomyces tsukubensis]OON72756.1 TetR family transcriptional regulator [Streptomyces tsukubensis]QFR96856.1 TetR family transcriptional regulator [Streptomyces tsukubensis]